MATNLYAGTKNDTIRAVDNSFADGSKRGLMSFLRKTIANELDLRVLGSPILIYQPETSWALGLAVAYYLHSDDEQGKHGMVGFEGVYTLNHQFKFHLHGSAYLGKTKKMLLYGKLTYSSNIEPFYGIGNRYENLLQSDEGNLSPLMYNSQKLNLTLQPQYCIGNWRLGLNINIRSGSNDGITPDIVRQYSLVGVESSVMSGLGVLASYDSRDNMFYPNQGVFLKFTTSHYRQAILSSYNVDRLQLDFIHFFDLGRNFAFGYHLFGEAMFSNTSNRAFSLMPTIGGTEIMRGIIRNNWCDDIAMALQTELRIPVWRMIKAAAFCSVGDVYNYNQWQWATPKIGYGIGLRVQVNKSKAHLRIDVAKQNFDKNIYWYFTMNEAF